MLQVVVAISGSIWWRPFSRKVAGREFWVFVHRHMLTRALERAFNML